MHEPREIWPGTTGPSTGSPARRPGSIRRTTSVDICRPDGARGDLVLIGRGRDLVSPASNGRPIELGRAATTVRIDYPGDRTVRVVEVTDSDLPVLRSAVLSLSGVRSSSGFRAALERGFGEFAHAGSLTVQLLDETPVATLISGSALARQQLAAPRQDVPGRQHLRRRLPPIDVCTGWKEGGVLAIAAAGGRPMLGEGPPAPSLSRHGDDHAWHELAVLAVHDMRRRRRLDLVVDGNAIVFDALFRDSLREASGIETVVHEYGVTGLIDRADRIVRRLTVTPRVLPGPDCPGAVLSAQRLVGRAVDSLRTVVSEEFAGPSTCTHLNDELRSLSDIPRLLEQLDHAG